MKVILNEVSVDMPELELFKLVNTEWIQIPETEGIFCAHCGCPVRFNMKTPRQMLGKCQNCQHVMMQQKQYGMKWEDAEIVMFKLDRTHQSTFLRPVFYARSLTH